MQIPFPSDSAGMPSLRPQDGVLRKMPERLAIRTTLAPPEITIASEDADWKDEFIPILVLNRKKQHEQVQEPPGSIRLQIARRMLTEEARGIANRKQSSTVIADNPAAWQVALAVLNAARSQKKDLLLPMLELLCALAFPHLAVSRNRQPEQSGLLREWQIQVVEERIARHRGERLALQHLAECCRLSTGHFARAFKATYGRTVHQHLTLSRILRAQEFLSKSRMPIAEIALECGFSDQSSFSRRFAAMTEVSPAVWRRGIWRSRKEEAVG